MSGMNLMKFLVKHFPQKAWEIRLLAFKATTPMLVYVAPEIVEINQEFTKIKVPLNFRTKNGFDSMFFAAIAAGIDLTGGFYGFGVAEENQVGVLYKDVSIQFKRRVDEDLILVTKDNRKVSEAIVAAASSGERISIPVSVDGFSLGYSSDMPVVSATATLSAKKFK